MDPWWCLPVWRFINSPYLTWQPRVDGVFLTDNPQKLVAQGSVALIPVVSGCVDDKGTVLALSSTNITNTAELDEYLASYFFKDATETRRSTMLKHYPDDQPRGSPYNTGYQNALAPQYKRTASILGDAIFQGPRRYFLQSIADKQPVWSYLSKRSKNTPFFGSLQNTDLNIIFNNGDMSDYLISFVNNLDPNVPSKQTRWQAYTKTSPTLLTFQDSGMFPRIITRDTYRKDEIAYLTQLLLDYPLWVFNQDSDRKDGRHKKALE